MNATDLAWAAGFFDGEGNITIARNFGPGKGRGRRLKISLAQVDPEPLRFWQTLFGGIVRVSDARRENGNHRVLHEWTVGSRDALTVLLLLEPYLRHKQGQAQLAIDFQRGKVLPGQKVNEWKIAEEEAAQLALTEAHHFIYVEAAA